MNSRPMRCIILIFTYIFAMFLLPNITLNFLANIYTDIVDIQAYGNLISYAVLLIITLLFFGQELKQQFKQITSGKKFLRSVLFGWFLLYAASYISSIIVVICTQSNDTSVNQQTITNVLAFHPMIMSFMTVICAPLCEEAVFRLTIMNGFKHHPWIGIILSSFLFGIIHVIGAGDYIYLIQYMAMGLALGYVYYRHQNIWYSIGVHALQNFISTLLVLAMTFLL